jgi:hypothetical protein
MLVPYLVSEDSEGLLRKSGRFFDLGIELLIHLKALVMNK